MSFCTSCGQQVDASERFCTACGAVRKQDETKLPQPADPGELRWTNKVFGFTAEYYVNPEGAGLQASKTTGDLNTGITVAGILLGSLNAAGAGMIAKGQESQFIGWDESRSIAFNKKKKTVTVTRKSFVFPVRLYCTGENYEQVASFIREHVNPDLVRG